MSAIGWRAVALVAVMALASSCGSDGDEETTSADGAAGDVATVDALIHTRSEPVAVDRGTVFVGGYHRSGAEEVTYEPLDTVTLVSTDGRVTALPPMPGEAPVFVTDVTHRDGVVDVAGVRCVSGQEVSDTGRVLCQPGGAALLRLDLDTEEWTEVPAPDAVSTDHGEVRGMRLASFGDHLVFSGLGAAGAYQSWIATDGGTWEGLPAVDGQLCTAGDDLVAIDSMDDVEVPEVEAGFGTPSTYAAGGELPTEPVSMMAWVFDPVDGAWSAPVTSPSVDALASSASGGCTAAGALFALVTGDGGALVSFTPGSGFVVAEDPSLARWMSVIPTTGTLSVVTDFGDRAVTVDQASADLDAHPLEGLPGVTGYTPVLAGSGSGHLLSLEVGHQPVLTPLGGAAADRESGDASSSVGGLVPVPLSAREFPTLSAYRDSVLVIGGQVDDGGTIAQVGDGALLDVETGRWVAVPAAPTSAPIHQPSVAWSEAGFLVAGPACEPVVPGPAELIDVCSPRSYEAAFYRFDTNSWERLPALPPVAWEGPSAVAIALHGGSAIFNFGESYGGRTSTWVLNAAGASWSDGEWQSVEDPGLVGLCATDAGMVSFVSDDGAVEVRILDGAGWRSIGSAPFDSPDGEFLPVCGPSEAVVHTYDGSPATPAWLLDLDSGEWRSLGSGGASRAVVSNVPGEAAGATLDGMRLTPSGRFAEWPWLSPSGGARPRMGDEAPGLDEADGEWLDGNPERVATTTRAAVGLYDDPMHLAIVRFE